MTEKQTAAKRKLSAQERFEKSAAGRRLPFFLIILGHALLIAVLFGTPDIVKEIKELPLGVRQMLLWFPPSWAAANRLANAGYRWWLGYLGGGAFFIVLIWEQGIIMDTLYVLIIAALLALPPKKKKPESIPDKDTPEN